uniref:Rexo1_1 protein n=1 Tax=Fopius arisanus TaxID=64838 RepID=A0A0C9R8I6_9HYME
MLPSTGYFKSINCPFYDSGTCDRPYCHFKHLRRDDVPNPAPSIVGYSTVQEPQKIIESVDGGEKSGATPSQTPNPEMIQQLVSDAVSKALADQGVTDSDNVSKDIVSKVVEGLKPTLVPAIGKHSGVPQSITKPCVYNPTPISELRKRHIAVPVYNPTRESKVAVKRKSTEDSAKPWLSALPESIKNDQKRISEITYKPTAIVHDKDIGDPLNYVPTTKSDDSNSSDYSKRKEAYYPKCKKRREEYVPKKVKAPLQSVAHLDEVSLDSFDPEFNLLDDILIGDPKGLKNYESSSQDMYSIEGRFSDEEYMEEPEATKEVRKIEEGVTQEAIIIDEPEKKEDNDNGVTRDFTVNTTSNSNKNNENCRRKDSKKDKNSKSNHDDESRRGSVSSESSKHSETHKSSIREHSNKENSTEKKSTSHSSKNSSSDRDKKSSHSRRDSKDHNKSSNSSHSHRSSSSRHKDSKKHKSKSSSSHSTRDKSHQSSSHSDKSATSKENTHHKSSRHDKKKSSNSSRSKSGEKSTSKSSEKSSRSSYKSKDTKESSEKNQSDHDSSSEAVNNFIGEELLQSSDSEHDVEEECLKIFQEYQVTEAPKNIQIHQTKKANEVIEEVGKKRVAHPSAEYSVTRNAGPAQPLKKAPNPQQRMYDRWRMMREAAADKAAERASKQTIPETEEIQTNNTVEIKTKNIAPIKTIHNEPQVNGNGRVRIAHVPYAMSLALSKKKVVDSTSKPMESKTVAQTAKGTPRIAHIPQTVPTLVRPEPLQVANQKFAINVRQYYVNLMHDICVQIYTNGDDAAQRALREELACHERCKALAVYKNSCMLAAHRLRKEVDQGELDGSVPSASGMLSHDAVLAGKSKGSWSVVKVKKAVTDFKGSALYCMLKKWIMTETQLRDNGFPRAHPEGPKGRAMIYATRNQPLISKVPNERFCIRCGQAYMVDKRGCPVKEQNCIYHWGRKFTVRGEGRYSCCQQYGSAGGCTDAKNHVWDFVDYENLRGYVGTLPKEGCEEEDQGVYALDCEMTYTTQGLELTRVTVINEDCNVIYETLVKPDNPIIDYNTRFSGITEENMAGVTTSLLDVQATLLTMFSDHTILVGHSLESDFKALKLIHNTVVDTSMMFPHKNGPPYKRALRNLCSEYLRKIIQNDGEYYDVIKRIGYKLYFTMSILSNHYLN